MPLRNILSFKKVLPVGRWSLLSSKKLIDTRIDLNNIDHQKSLIFDAGSTKLNNHCGCCENEFEKKYKKEEDYNIDDFTLIFGCYVDYSDNKSNINK
jgi:hypothetical protein